MHNPLKRPGKVAAATLLAASLAVPAQAIVPAPHVPQKTSAPVTYGAPVIGIPAPCPASHPYPSDATPSQVRTQLSKNLGIGLVGKGWDATANAPLVKIVWETLDGLSCTGYLSTIKAANPSFSLNASPISGFAWGDWGLTRPGSVTFDLGKWQEAYSAGDKGRLVRIIVHELGHAWSQTPQAQGPFNRFATMYARTGNFGPYAHNVNENFSEIIGYYVARCAQDNPYDAKANVDGRHDAYYELVRADVFAGREFAGAPGTAIDCSMKPVITRDPKEALDRAPISRP